MSTNKK